MKGVLVHQLAHGMYAAGHYEVSWTGESSGSSMVGSSVYVIQMKANNFDKRLKLVKIQTPVPGPFRTTFLNRVDRRFEYSFSATIKITR